MEKRIQAELSEQLTLGKGCIVFDFGCFLPYSDPEDFTFCFSLDREAITDCKLNHRYPNKGYYTISKKCGQKISKIGYPYFVDIGEAATMNLCIEVGFKGAESKMIFPLRLSLTAEKPICGLSLRLNPYEYEMLFTSFEPAEDGGWHEHFWSNQESSESNDRYTQLSMPIKEDATLVYETVITPIACTPDKLLLL